MNKFVFLQPMDIWLFRDGKPFSAGGDHHAESLFPPYPTVIQGAFRSKQLSNKNMLTSSKAEIEAEVGTPTDFGRLRLRGPFLARKERNDTIALFIPQPADAISVPGKQHMIRHVSSPVKTPTGVKTSQATEMLIGLDEKPMKGENCLWLSFTELERYLDGNEVMGTPAEDLFTREPRVGVGIDSARMISQDGMLYEVSFIRPRTGVGLAVEYSGYTGWPDKGTLQLGGESRGSTYEFIPSQLSLLDIPQMLPKQFKMLFTTPTYFANGWLPKKTDWSDFFTNKVDLKAAAIGRYETVGGFDMSADPAKVGIHRAARRFVPAGSIYYFQSPDGPVQLNQSLVQNAVTDYGSEIGFGQIIIKEWKNV
jgi:CRISPR-associated protein Cmr3